MRQNTWFLIDIWCIRLKNCPQIFSDNQYLSLCWVDLYSICPSIRQKGVWVCVWGGGGQKDCKGMWASAAISLAVSSQETWRSQMKWDPRVELKWVKSHSGDVCPFNGCINFLTFKLHCNYPAPHTVSACLQFVSEMSGDIMNNMKSVVICVMVSNKLKKVFSLADITSR